MRELTASEVVEWEALYRIDPWGEERADLRSAIIAWTFAMAHSKRGKKPKLSQFMPDYSRVENKRTGMTDKTFARNLIAWHKALGGIGEVPAALREIAEG